MAKLTKVEQNMLMLLKRVGRISWRSTTPSETCTLNRLVIKGAACKINMTEWEAVPPSQPDSRD